MNAKDIYQKINTYLQENDIDNNLYNLLLDCKDYLVNTDPDIYIEVTKEEVDKQEQEGEALQHYINSL